MSDDLDRWMARQLERLRAAGWSVSRPALGAVLATNTGRLIILTLGRGGPHATVLHEGRCTWGRERCARVVDEACGALGETSPWERDAEMITYMRPPQRQLLEVSRITWGTAHEEE